MTHSTSNAPNHPSTKKSRTPPQSLSKDIIHHSILPYLPLPTLFDKISVLSRDYHAYIENNYDTWLKVHFSAVWGAYREERGLSAKECIKLLMETKRRYFHKQHAETYARIFGLEPDLEDLLLIFVMHPPMAWFETSTDPTDQYVDMYIKSFEMYNTDVEACKRITFNFLTNGSGTMYCLWFKDDVEPPMVVMLGDEGELAVVSRTVMDFMRMVASGTPEFGFHIQASRDMEIPSVRSIQEHIEEGILENEENAEHGDCDYPSNLELLRSILDRIGKKAFSAAEMVDYWKKWLMEGHPHHIDLLSMVG